MLDSTQEASRKILTPSGSPFFSHIVQFPNSSHARIHDKAAVGCLSPCFWVWMGQEPPILGLIFFSGSHKPMSFGQVII